MWSDEVKFSQSWAVLCSTWRERQMACLSDASRSARSKTWLPNGVNWMFSPLSRNLESQRLDQSLFWFFWHPGEKHGTSFQDEINNSTAPASADSVVEMHMLTMMILCQTCCNLTLTKANKKVHPTGTRTPDTLWDTWWPWTSTWQIESLHLSVAKLPQTSQHRLLLGRNPSRTTAPHSHLAQGQILMIMLHKQHSQPHLHSQNQRSWHSSFF